ncbi:MAG: 16S rRNA (guanine(527)-N(7))-methyltransferase RsmG [Xanthomonadales bacterium]|nr:16S rRNA (guanine(527)-N(7))-methyltransferase RsmG [Gammaproteobacteria bacterium]MBT8053523.1 16S rRNA (guanine(527)-N(7))-methyltransferase RsmG [Gammaproteobacteria bacterium]NND57996.1 16S rRNA (guanine(527)-N(7))-methyltransferase RsmG [Xanthomonadales bacterium]NNK50838.1 16S rRNA (guanine(527)-N(7))-methyltransferase RsmG [Xanthomonadales bacterium]
MPAESPAETLHRAVSEYGGLELAPSQERALMAYLDELQHWNKAYNLTAIKGLAAMVVRHVLDSLSVSPWINGRRLLDAGTGAGLPGVPLAIAMPVLEVTLLDSSGKKIRFLNHVRRALAIENIFPVQARLENYDPPRPFDAVISRAFTSLASFARAARHLAPGTSRLLAMKARYPESELGELPDWVTVESAEKLTVPGLQEERHLVIMSVNP